MAQSPYSVSEILISTDISFHSNKINQIKVLRYNGTVYEKSINQLTKYLPEITDSFLSKHFCLAVARANEEAKLRHTSLITNALHDETLAIQHGQKYTATPLKEGHRMSQNNNNRKRFRHDTDYSSIFYHYKMTRIYNHSFYIQYTTYAFYVRIWGLP
ncbi:Hypothetical_protein [Hexamita inflata]|uniref:Hypothetical_protein n=1 Tax=Hexamita inflata TaxID=28002 RepID=A0AA86QI93_9EUKA|nr:Hypothetical protein HINF_LOCUS47466 [Hexamita inflata]